MQGFRDLRVYQQAYELAMEVYKETQKFPKDERYSLTDQIRRSTRGIAANIAEGFRKRQYPKMFANKIADADGEAAETQVWLDFARDCGYLSPDRHAELLNSYQEIGRMLGKILSMPERFVPRERRS